MTSLENHFDGLRCLVTGGAGFIGSHISEALLKLGAEVIALDDLSNGKTVNLPQSDSNLRFVNADIRKYELGDLGEIDAIFHEAARGLIPSFKDPVADLEVNTAVSYTHLTLPTICSV